MKSELITGMLAVVVLAGCASTTPRMDEKFGEAVNKAKAQQIINPDASQNADPVAGIDGEAAKSSIDNYHRVYKSPSAATTGSVSGGVGTSGSTLK